MTGVDPLLPLIAFGHPDVNGARVELLVQATVALGRRDPAGFRAALRQHLEWAQADAVARDRAGTAPMLAQPRAAVPRLTDGGGT